MSYGVIKVWYPFRMKSKERFENYVREKREYEQDLASGKRQRYKAPKEEKGSSKFKKLEKIQESIQREKKKFLTKKEHKRLKFDEDYNETMRLLQREEEKRYYLKRNSWLKSKYNISYDDYLERLNSQDSVCAICKTSQVFKEREDGEFFVDHCHRAGYVRGLLCAACNTGLGHFERLLPHLSTVLDYLNLNLELVPTERKIIKSEESIPESHLGI